jgi:hypothetical protein
MEEVIQALKKSWEDGFFYDLRGGVFDEEAYEKLKLLLQASLSAVKEAYEKEPLNKEFVSLAWSIPLFLEWQRENLINKGVYVNMVTAMVDFFFEYCSDIFENNSFSAYT